ncbi:type II secretion system protein F [Clostridia bacterium]|nr:type II secretion system protein F [Clostridia bacterium]
MAKFKYKAVTMSGVVHTGVQDAPDRDSLMSALRAEGLYATAIKDVTKSGAAAGLFAPKINIQALSMFCSQLAAVLRAGVPLASALDIMRDQVDDRTLKKILAEVLRKLRAGRSLTEAFSPFKERFPQMFLNMLEAGETSGSLDSCLERAGETFVKQAKITRKVKAAMAYPAVLLLLTAAITAFLLVTIVPMFAGQYALTGTQLPALTQTLLNLSALLQRQWLPIILIIIAAAVLFRLWLGTDAGRTSFDKFKLKIPVIGRLIRVVCAGRYTRTLSTMNAAGVPLTNALEVTAHTVGNRFLEKKIDVILEDVRMGSSITAPLERMKIFPALITHMTRLGEESGTLDELLEHTAGFYEEQSDAAIASMTALLEPLIIIIMGLVIGTVVLSIMMPMYGSVTMAGA